MSPSVDKAREQFPVLWGITGACANGCEDGIRMGEDASVRPDGKYICCHCADAAREELANQLETLAHAAE